MTRLHGFRTRKAASKPRIEGLEKRWVLSSVIATSPAAGAVLTSSPTTYDITFDSPIDQFSLGFADIVIDQVGADGSLSPAYSDADLPYENLDDTGTQLTLDTFATLNPGNYRVILSGYGSLMGIDGSTVANPDGSDLTLADFTIGHKGVGLSDAIDLGTIGPAGLSMPGNLDFTSNPNAVQLYKFTVPAGHFWRVGAAVSAQADDSSLNSALALFDSQGAPLATDDLGLASAPADPYLFRGLSPGVYYIGVSGADDLPGQPGGYDPATQSPGLAQSQAGGDFTLHLVADVADSPGTLIDFNVNRADPLDPTPTGFTMQFSTALDLGTSGPDVFDRTSGGVQVVGQDGTVWPIAAVNYDSAHSALKFLFRERLPQGLYSIRMNQGAPLRDLAGLVPVSPTMPAGMLATFQVGPDVRARQSDGTLAVPDSSLQVGKVLLDDQGNEYRLPDVTRSEDLGPLTPDDVLSGLSRTVTLQPGETVAFRVVSLTDDFYKLVINYSDAPLGMEIDNGVVATMFDPGPANQNNSLPVGLGLGERILRFTAIGDQPVTFKVGLSIAAFRWDSLLANGLGQGPALNLRLISTDSAASFPLADSAVTPAGLLSNSSTAASGPVAGPFLPPPGTLTTITAVGVTLAPTPGVLPPTAQQASSALPFEIGGVLVGRPNTDGERIAAIGPGEGKEIALASVGLGQSLDASGILRGTYASPGQAELKPGEGAAEPIEPGEAAAPIVDGSIPPQAVAEASTKERAEEPPSETFASLPNPGSIHILPDGDVEVTGNGSQSVVVGEPTEGDEAKKSSSKTAWVVGMVGISALSARWILQRRRRAIQAAAPSSRLEKAIRSVPGPHSRGSMRLPKTLA